MRHLALTLLALSLSVPAAAQTAAARPAASVTTGASAAERRMAEFAAADAAYGEALLERLVNQNSGTLNSAGVRAVGAMMEAEFAALGLTSEWIDGASWGRAGHLIARHRGNGRGQRILMIGHLDTVFEPESPFQRYSRDGNIATGPGVGDDKGGLVVIIGALRAMRHAGTLANADIVIVLTGDEERMGAPVDVARGPLVEAAMWADAALEYENLVRDDGQDYGTIARRSSSNWTITATGNTGHSSAIFTPGMGYGAIYELARILDAFRRELPEANLTYNVALVAGGTPAGLDDSEEHASATGKTNIVPSDAVACNATRAPGCQRCPTYASTSARSRSRAASFPQRPSLASCGSPIASASREKILSLVHAIAIQRPSLVG